MPCVRLGAMCQKHVTKFDRDGAELLKQNAQIMVGRMVVSKNYTKQSWQQRISVTLGLNLGQCC